MITNALMWFVPAEAVPQIATLLIVLCGLAVMLRMVRAAIWLGMFAFLLLAFEPVIEPLVDELVDAALDAGIAGAEQLPWWILVIIVSLFSLIILRVVLSWFLGRRAADNAVGALAAAGIIGLIRIVIQTPFRLVGFLLRLRSRY